MGPGLHPALLTLHLTKFVRVFVRLLRDRRVPWWSKVLPIIGLGYVVSPLDVIPGFPFVVVGWLDDLAVLYFSLWLFVRLAPTEVVHEHVMAVSRSNQQ